MKRQWISKVKTMHPLGLCKDVEIFQSGTKVVVLAEHFAAVYTD